MSNNIYYIVYYIEYLKAHFNQIIIMFGNIIIFMLENNVLRLSSN